MVFKLLKIRKSIKEARQDPGGFAGGEAAGVFLGLLAIPAVIALLAIVLFFILGFTSLLGGPMGFFKFLFVVSVIVSFVIASILRPVIRLIRRGTKRVVNKGAELVREVKSEEV